MITNVEHEVKLVRTEMCISRDGLLSKKEQRGVECGELLRLELVSLLMWNVKVFLIGSNFAQLWILTEINRVIDGVREIMAQCMLRIRRVLVCPERSAGMEWRKKIEGCNWLTQVHLEVPLNQCLCMSAYAYNNERSAVSS